MNLLELFNDKIFDSVNDKELFKELRPHSHKYYLPNQYALEMKKIFDEHHWDSKEFTKSSKQLPFCSVSSSARLAFLDFQANENLDDVEFECDMYNDFCHIAPTKMDIVKGSTCFECKCQEIVDGENEVLRISYYNNKKSLLFKEFNIDKMNFDIYEKRSKKGELKYKYLSFSCRNLNIDIDKTYYELHFNLKQLICHLIAIANNKRENSILQYIIYVPKIELIDSSSELKKMYSEFINELDKIFAPETEIIQFATRHKITILKPLFKTVDSFKVIENFEDMYR